jgi:hypothetical protein
MMAGEIEALAASETKTLKMAWENAMTRVIDDSHEMAEKVKQRAPRSHISEFCGAMVISRGWWQCSEAVKIGRKNCWPKASSYREENSSSLNSNIGGSDFDNLEVKFTLSKACTDV